jgi:hypothetical protein
MALWDLLFVICFFTTIGGALIAAHLAKAGFGGYALAFVVGAVVATGSLWALRSVVKVVFENPRGRPRSLKTGWLVAIYLAVIPWIYFSGLLAIWASAALLRFVG